MQDEGFEEFLDSYFETHQPLTPSFVNTTGMKSGQSSGSKSRKRARSSDDVIENLTNMVAKLGNFYETTKEDIRELASCFKHEKEGVERQMRVLDELKLVDGLTNAQRMMAGEIITKEQHHIDYFFTLPNDWKKDYVEHLLRDMYCFCI